MTSWNFFSSVVLDNNVNPNPTFDLDREPDPQQWGFKLVSLPIVSYRNDNDRNLDPDINHDINCNKL